MFLDFPIFRGLLDKIISGMTMKSFGSFNNLLPGFEEQYKKLATHIKSDPVFFSKQLHGDKIIIVFEKSDDVFEGDAFITNKKGVPLVIKVADCQGILLFDPVTVTIAAVHAGWKGIAVNIVGKTIKKMEEVFSVNPKNLLVAVSPSIGPCCAEFSDPIKELPAFMSPYIKDKHVDLWSATIDQLKNAGVSDEHVQISDECTKSNPDKYFSYRNGDEGRMAVFISLK